MTTWWVGLEISTLVHDRATHGSKFKELLLAFPSGPVNVQERQINIIFISYV